MKERAHIVTVLNNFYAVKKNSCQCRLYYRSPLGRFKNESEISTGPRNFFLPTKNFGSEISTGCRNFDWKLKFQPKTGLEPTSAIKQKFLPQLRLKKYDKRVWPYFFWGSLIFPSFLPFFFVEQKKKTREPLDLVKGKNL